MIPPRQHQVRPQLGDEAASFLRDQITSGTMPAGAPVRPETVADELGISTTPAREALQALRAEGFLDLAPRRGFTVAKVDGNDVRDMFLVQSMVAGELAARAAKNATPETVASLEQITHRTRCRGKPRGPRCPRRAQPCFPPRDQPHRRCTTPGMGHQACLSLCSATFLRNHQRLA